MTVQHGSNIVMTVVSEHPREEICRFYGKQTH